MKIDKNVEYYITNYRTLRNFFSDFLEIIKDKTISHIFSNAYLTWKSDTKNNKSYTTDQYIFIVFNDNDILKLKYNVWSLIYVQYTDLASLPITEKEYNQEFTTMDFPIKESNIIDCVLETFAEEYKIDHAIPTVRPAADEYFKQITFYLNSGSSKLCICASNENGNNICNVWIESSDETTAEDENTYEQLKLLMTTAQIPVHTQITITSNLTTPELRREMISYLSDHAGMLTNKDLMNFLEKLIDKKNQGLRRLSTIKTSLRKPRYADNYQSLSEKSLSEHFKRNIKANNQNES